MVSDPTPAESQKSPRGRWWQFSLRTLLLLVVPVACVFAWLGAEYRAGQRQHEAIAWVERQGGSIEYDDEATQANWRRRWLGEWYPESVRGISFYNTQVSDLTPLSELENLQYLGLDRTQVSDLAPLSELENLRYLSLDHTRVWDLTPLAGLVKLESLSLRGTRVNGVMPLAGLVKLEWLFLPSANVSEEDVQVLRRALPKCNIIEPWPTKPHPPRP